MEVRRIAIMSAPDISYLCSGQDVENPDSVTALEKKVTQICDTFALF
jgi:hypothetical protein